MSNRDGVLQLVRDRIYKGCLEKNLSMRQLSLSIDKSPDYIQKVISGKIVPNLNVLNDICSELEFQMNELFDPSVNHPAKYHRLLSYIEKLTEPQMDALIVFLQEMSEEH